MSTLSYALPRPTPIWVTLEGSSSFNGAFFVSSDALNSGFGFVISFFIAGISDGSMLFLISWYSWVCSMASAKATFPSLHSHAFFGSPLMVITLLGLGIFIIL